MRRDTLELHLHAEGGQYRQHVYLLPDRHFLILVRIPVVEQNILRIVEVDYIEEAGDLTVNLWYNRGNEDVIEAVGEQWETNLGIGVNVVNMEWGAYLETLDECNN